MSCLGWRYLFGTASNTWMHSLPDLLQLWLIHYLINYHLHEVSVYLLHSLRAALLCWCPVKMGLLFQCFKDEREQVCLWKSLGLVNLGQRKSHLEGLGNCWAVTDCPLDKCRTCWEWLCEHLVDMMCPYSIRLSLTNLFCWWSGKKPSSCRGASKNGPTDELLKFLLSLSYGILSCAETNLTDFSNSS